MPAVQLAPVVRQRVFSNLGVVAPGALLTTQRSGTSTNYPTYTTAAGTTAHANPIVASASGLFPAIYLVVGVAYRFTLTESDGSPIWGPNDGVEAGSGSAIINAVDEGAIGDDSTDNAVALQAAINAAVAAQVPLYLPAGIYRTSANLTIPGRLVMYGDGKGLSQIKAIAGVTTLLAWTPAGTQTARSQLTNFVLDGNSIATCGLFGQFVTHLTMRSMEIIRCAFLDTSAAVVLGGQVNAGGWNTILDDIEISFNLGHGLLLDGANNSVLITGCKVFSNDSIGIIVQSSAAVKIVGTTIEGNDTTGLYAMGGVQNLDIDNAYLLANASNGMNFDTPALTVQAEVILNGGGSRTAISNAFPCVGVRFSNCYMNASQTNDGCIAAFGYDALTVENCRMESTSAAGSGITPILVSYWSTAVVRTPKLRLANNSNFGPPFAFLAVSGVLSYNPRDIHIDTIRVRNYADLELNTWGTVVAGGASTWLRSSLTFNGVAVPVWNLNSTAVGTSAVFGFSLDAALYTDLHGKYVAFGMWVKADNTNKGANVYVGTGVQGSGNAASTDWTWVSGILLWPTSGTLLFGVQKNGAASTGDIYAALPILMELGAEYYTLFGQIVPQAVFAGTAKPTTGVWKAGDQIRYTGAAAAAPPGAYCTVAGTPGTWKSLAAIEA